ncbi:FAD-dependent oxidoreductase [Rhodocytophaga aerolata]|uniref:FAD-dependent oxidoreductase n=1 Tax=Rhodocytophaga aerolata TaxID=455078 RepID=A0ABT8RFH3_9BACT|nr:FAD-dependent oxidoreductase [Rhodocytophaga aerolata]MDO1450446.1 FAD-dependent oxidoreductase [Rhodocytophaga aerolata]
MNQSIEENAGIRKVFVILLAVLSISLPSKAQQNPVTEVDICIYGGTSAGVIAAYTARKMRKTVLLVEPGKNLGGMSSGGLGYTDIGNKYAVTGLARDFYRRIGQHYGKFEQWTFEPHVAENLFKDYVKRAGYQVLYENRLTGVKKDGNVIKEITLENSTTPATSTNRTVRAKIFMDCTYEGDLMAKAGVSYTIGREANSQYKETFNGVQLMKGHQLPDGIDPYVEPGKPESGLLWGINDGALLPAGSGDKKVQAYNFRICLTNNPANLVPITQPENYDPKKYELLIRLMEKSSWKSLQSGFIWSLMPNGKTDINNRNGFSTDMIGMNWEYPEADYATRAKIWQDHVDYTKGLLYFVGNDPRVPEHIRQEMKAWGYPKDEYTNNGHWTHQLYVREARRMVGELVMTQHHCQGKEVVTDGIGMAAYTMDSHNCDRIVVNGMVKNEGNVEEGGFGPYPISYRAILPKQAEASNLLVPVCLSATHIAYGSIRMEPVFMVLGQSAAVAASLAIDTKQPLQKVDITKVQQMLKANPLADGSTPEILVDNDDKAQVKLTGNWTTETKGGYGPTFLIDDSKGNTSKSVQYTPAITEAGSYAAYLYLPKLPTAASTTEVKVFDGKNSKNLSFRKDDVLVVGQTSGEWVSLGTYTLPKGNKAYVEVTNQKADGLVVADAVLFVPVKK